MCGGVAAVVQFITLTTCYNLDVFHNSVGCGYAYEMQFFQRKTDDLLAAERFFSKVLNPGDTRRLLLRTFVAQLAAVTKICPQPRQNAAATKRTTSRASSDTDDDVILIAGVLGAFVNKCKKKLIEQMKHLNSSLDGTT